MPDKAFQDHYSDEHSTCYGCGRLNEHGLKIKSFWDGEASVCHFTPEPFHTAVPGYVYGGLLASVIDCHGTGTAAAMAYREAGRPMGEGEELRFVTASLHVDYLRPTPIDVPMELRGNVQSYDGRKAVVDVVVSSNGKVCVKGQVVAVRLTKPFPFAR